MELGPGPCALPPAGSGSGSGAMAAAAAAAAGAAAGPCSEMLQVAEEAFRSGNFELAAEIYGSELAELPQPERGLCLRRADALARAGRMAEALDAYGAAARLARLRPDELRELAESFALSIRDKELRLPPWAGGAGGSHGGEGEGLGDPACCRPPELFACPLCRRLLCEPVTLHCGHTHCRRCAEPGDCGRCHRPRRPAEPSSTSSSSSSSSSTSSSSSSSASFALCSAVPAGVPATSPLGLAAVPSAGFPLPGPAATQSYAGGGCLPARPMPPACCLAGRAAPSCPPGTRATAPNTLRCHGGTPSCSSPTCTRLRGRGAGTPCVALPGTRAHARPGFRGGGRHLDGYLVFVLFGTSLLQCHNKRSIQHFACGVLSIN